MEQLKAQWTPLDGSQRAEQLPAWKTIRRDIPGEFFDYHPSACQIRLSDANVLRLNSTTSDQRAVYKALKGSLAKPPTSEKIGEKAQAAKLFLHYKADAIVHNAEALRLCITQETQQAIEHRTQVKLAHAQKIEHLTIALDHLILLLQSYRPAQAAESKENTAPLLSGWLTEAKALQSLLQESPSTLTAATIGKNILTWEAYRKQLAQSIPTGWMNFFSDQRRLGQQQVQSLQTDLQSALTHLVRPLYGFDDHAALTPPERIKESYAIAPALEHKKEAIHSECKKMEKIKNTFAK
jgi:hypothetical protein